MKPVVIYTEKGPIKLIDNPFNVPEWNKLHKRFYVEGYRWIKSRQAFSKSRLVHNFAGWSLDARAVFDKRGQR